MWEWNLTWLSKWICEIEFCNGIGLLTKNLEFDIGTGVWNGNFFGHKRMIGLKDELIGDQYLECMGICW